MRATNNTVLSLAERLISIPSFVNDVSDERDVVKFLESFFAECLPQLSVKRQYLAGSKRANLIVRSNGPAKLLALGHIDTVQPKDGWQTDPLQPDVRGGNLYGLGAADMKGSLAAFLAALCRFAESASLDGLLLLLYVDEEYEFKGMRRLLESKELIKERPRLMLSLDGTLEPASGCRGLIELSLTVRGKSGHAASPASGVNAITQTLAAIQKVEQQLSEYQDEYLGVTTCNVAYIRGGVRQTTGRETVWQQEGNVIADTTQLIFEVRPAVEQVNAVKVKRMLETDLKTRSLKLEQVTVKHDIAPWPADYGALLDKLKVFYKQAGVPLRLADITRNGYVDVQMFTQVIPAPTFVIGSGGYNKHAANEYVPLANLEQAAKLYTSILKGYLL